MNQPTDRIMQLALKAEGILNEASSLCLQEAKTYSGFVTEADSFAGCARLVHIAISMLQLRINISEREQGES